MSNANLSAAKVTAGGSHCRTLTFAGHVEEIKTSPLTRKREARSAQSGELVDQSGELVDQDIVNRQQIHLRLKIHLRFLRCGSYKHLANNKSDQPQK